MTQRTPVWLRCETKSFERRAALTPTTAKRLLDAGFDVAVEEDPQRIFDIEEYRSVGCEIKPHNSWPNAPTTTTIIGLKELPVSTDPLHHTHIQFAHCYKNQGGWIDVLSRFARGGGTLYDLEFLADEHGRRVAAFGFHAGFAGAAVGVLAFAARKEGSDERLGPLESYPNEGEMVKDVKDKLAASGKNVTLVKALVMGALGRCGKGAVDLFRKVGLAEDNVLKWDMEETARGGPFPEILDVDIFVNCIYLSSTIPPFVSPQLLEEAGTSRRLTIIVDVSCDTTNPFNPIPIYTINTTFHAPTVDAAVSAGTKRLEVVSIDHLPTLLPREASEQFSNDLLPSLFKYPGRAEERVWTDAEKLFRSKLQEAGLVQND